MHRKKMFICTNLCRTFKSPYSVTLGHWVMARLFNCPGDAGRRAISDDDDDDDDMVAR